MKMCRRGSAFFWCVPALLLTAGCRTPQAFRAQADAAAAEAVAQAQLRAFGQVRGLRLESAADTFRRRLLELQGLPYAAAASLGTDRLEPVPHWPRFAETDSRQPGDGQASGPEASANPEVLSLEDALQIGARNSREYQAQKEAVFLSALRLDLERDAFRNSFVGLLAGAVESDHAAGAPTSGVVSTAEGRVQRLLKTGASLSTRIVFDLVQLLSTEKSSSWGVLADATMTVPLLSGAGRHIVTESLTQAERDVLYAVYRLERFRRTLGVNIVTGYLDVLQQHDRIVNAEQNYRRLAAAARRARRLAVVAAVALAVLAGTAGWVRAEDAPPAGSASGN